MENNITGLINVWNRLVSDMPTLNLLCEYFVLTFPKKWCKITLQLDISKGSYKPRQVLNWHFVLQYGKCILFTYQSCTAMQKLTPGFRHAQNHIQLTIYCWEKFSLSRKICWWKLIAGYLLLQFYFSIIIAGNWLMEII